MARTRKVHEESHPTGTLPAASLRALAMVRPIIGYRDIAIEWAVIGAVSALCIAYPHPLLYLLGVMIIGARQHALLILLHDGAHRLLARGARTNDLVGELCLAWPFVIVHMRNYRRTHFLHHRFVNTPADPDWTWKRAAHWPWQDGANRKSLWDFPTSRRRLLAILSANLLFYGFWTALRRSNDGAKRTASPGEKPFLAGWLIYQIIVFGILSYQGWLLYYLALWIVPMITWLQLCMLMRGIAEHFAIASDRRHFGETRTTVGSLFDKIFLVSHNIGYHIEHHLHPFIPYHALPECHERYMALPEFRDRAHVTHGYGNVLRECVRSSRSTGAEEPAHLERAQA